MNVEAQGFLHAVRSIETEQGTEKLGEIIRACSPAVRVSGDGVLDRDGAYANDRGLTVAIARRAHLSLVGYTTRDLRPHRSLAPWF